MQIEKTIAPTSFSELFAVDIYPIYKEHENTFDKDGIHGVLHIGRSIIASFILSRKCVELGLDSSTRDVIIATAFHDSGRKANGADYWEGISSQNCLDYLKKHSYTYNDSLTTNAAEDVAKMIVKRGVNNFQDAIDKYFHPIDFMCVYDADCLEIMRECCGRGGRNGFIKEKLLLYNYNYDFYVYYGSLINEWWSFICATENIKKELSTPDCFDKLMSLVKTNKNSFPLIYAGITN